MMDELETRYPCVGICTIDPDSGCCLGCGRPLTEFHDTPQEASINTTENHLSDTKSVEISDSPEM